MNKPLYEGSEWDVPLIERIWSTIEKVNTEKFGFDYYAPQIELITSEQMLDCYSSHAMPSLYDHWSFGKSFIQNERGYNKGQQGLAYEVVINTNPCIVYLMENNTATLQTLVLAHAAVGHSHFFKNNYLFKDWTDASSIVDYLKFAKNYIKNCEEKYGIKEVEHIIDACHSLQYNSVDKYKKPSKLSKELKKQREKQWDTYFESNFNDLWRTIPVEQKPPVSSSGGLNKKNCPEENLLYFLEKNSPILKEWEREILRIVRKLSQYFYPQRQTQLLNEGFATFCHHNLMTELHEQGYLTDGAYLEFLADHTAVVTQRPWSNKHYSGINVYALGFAMLQDVKRICMSPDEEDLKWFPDICNTDWLTTIKDIVANYRDESFILQFLSPKIVREFQLFSFNSQEDTSYYEVSGTHDDESFLKIRKNLAEQYDPSRMIPQIEIVKVDWDSDRWLYLEHTTKNNQRLDYDNMKRTTLYVHNLWGFPVKMSYKDLEGNEIDDI